MKKKAKIVWNHNLAYAIGLLATDGNLSSDGRHMALVSKDIEQIISVSHSPSPESYKE